MGLLLRTFLVAVSVMLAGAASAANPSDYDDCNGNPDHDRRITGCTRVLQDQNESTINRINALNSRGAAYGDKGDHVCAIADYNEAIRLDPKDVLAYNNRGVAYRARGDHDRAIADFNEAIRLDPKFTEAYRNRGLAHRDKGDIDGAIADYSEAIRLKPTYAKAYNSRSAAYRAKGDHARATADYNEAMRLESKTAVAGNSALSDELCKALGEVLAVRDLKSLAGDLESYEATKPERIEGMETDGGQFSTWAAKRELPDFLECTVNQYVTVKISGKREPEPVVYNCKKLIGKDGTSAETEFADAARAIHACLPQWRRRDDIPSENIRKWAGEKRAFIEHGGKTIIVSYTKLKEPNEKGFKLAVDISAQ